MSTLAHQRFGAAHRPPVLLLHPIATRGATWAAQAAVWSQHFHVIVADLPGHGDSLVDSGLHTLDDYADRVAGLLDALHIERAALVGLSFGGMVAQAFALSRPQRVSALVLAHCGARTPPAVRAAWDERLAAVQQTGMAGQVAPTLGRWFTPEFASRAPLTLAWVGAMVAGTDPAGYAAAVRAIQALDHLDRLHEIGAPTLVVSGAQDAAVTPDVVQAMASRIAGARQLVLEPAAHFGHIEQASAFTEQVGAWLALALRDAPGCLPPGP